MVNNITFPFQQLEYHGDTEEKVMVEQRKPEVHCKMMQGYPGNLKDDNVNIGLGNSLVPLPESVLTKTCDAILLHWATT